MDIQVVGLIMPAAEPIGVFDSGIGGLSVLRAIRRILPAERLIYLADSANAPFGQKGESFIRQRCFRLGSYLLERGAKSLVVACNTATASGIEDLRARISVPVVGMEPGIKPALKLSRTGVIAVLGTGMTLKSTRYARLANGTGPSGTILAQPCEGLVELIETARFDDPGIVSLLHRLIEPLLAQGADTLVLGCTHYPLVRRQIEEVADGRAFIVETGPAVARHLRNRLQTNDLMTPEQGPGRIELLTSGDPARLERCARCVLPAANCRVDQLPNRGHRG
jgi:glutamate racemase